ncbi:pectate lyase family protein [Saccharothrix deserti]|uniref:pectate lyase family protein n=1 Tax=Saccharothrix deserti TaxID=2593674 RepID=UPI001EE3CA29|nr:carbohydrate-binding protein [Saccharothrix deserti]
MLSQSAAQAAPTRYEAENSPAVCSGTTDTNWTGYSGSGFCNADNAAGAYAQFTVNASAAGTATLGIRFANGTTTRAADLVVNGSTVQGVSFEGTGAWSTWVTRTLTVPVNAGGNTVRLNPTTAAGLPNIDYLDVEVGGAPSVPYSGVPDGFAQGTTGGAGGQTVTVTTQADLNRYVTASEPYVIRVAGTINISPKGTELRVASNKTIVGVGTSGHIVGGGFILRTGVSNVIIRNLTIRDTRMPDDDPGDDSYDYDAIQMDTANRIWIDHNRLTRMNDGLIDSRKDNNNLTVSWNHITDNNKTFGVGWTENTTARITIHHNWFQDNTTRNPVVDNAAYAHLYNNHLDDISASGTHVTGSTKAVIENTYYDGVRDPYYVSGNAELVQRGEIVRNSSWASGRVKSRGSAFNPSSFYSYTLHPTADVPAMLRQHAGPQSGIGG